jgi:hypothetical protein
MNALTLESNEVRLANTLTYLLDDLNSEIDYEARIIIVHTLINTMGSKFVFENLPSHQPLINDLINSKGN